MSIMGRMTGAMTAGLMLAGCDQLGNPMETFAGKLPTPDEFQVVATKPLQMPRSLALPEPRLGERSPLQPNPQADATAALLGAGGATVTASASPGEAALLGAANAGASNPEIRAALASDVDAVDPNKPYEPPTVIELLSGGSDNKNVDALDPTVESARLRAEGIGRAPVDPKSTLEVPEEEAQKAEELGVGPAEYSNAPGLNRPNNQLNADGDPEF